MKKMVTHLSPRHLDDTLAVALLSQKYPQAEIEFIHPQDKKLEDYKKDPAVILVDVGGDYNSGLKNYDHHQDQNTPCSLVLVLKHEFPEYLEIFKEDERLKKALNFIDIKDRKGFKSALEETKENPSSVAFLLESMIVKTENGEDLRFLGKSLKSYLDGILKEKEKLKDVSVIYDNEFGLTVVYDTHGLKAGDLFKKYDADLVIQKNPFNENHTSIVKNTSKKEMQDIDLSKVFDLYNKVFLHNTGFIAVIDKRIENISLDNIVKTISCLFEKDKGNDSGISL